MRPIPTLQPMCRARMRGIWSIVWPALQIPPSPFATARVESATSHKFVNREIGQSSMQRLSITWLGHSTFIVRTPGGTRVLFDPWFTSNPSCPDAMKKPPKDDVILASHGHFDHMEDLIGGARESNATVI